MNPKTTGDSPPALEITRKTFERATIVGKMDDSKTWLDWLHSNGYRVVVSGPYTDREMHPDVDVTRFKFVAEREIA